MPSFIHYGIQLIIIIIIEGLSLLQSIHTEVHYYYYIIPVLVYANTIFPQAQAMYVCNGIYYIPDVNTLRPKRYFILLLHLFTIVPLRELAP